MISLLIQIINLWDVSIFFEVRTKLIGRLNQICCLSVLLFDAESSQLFDPSN
jgi:hypothetical protein